MIFWDNFLFGNQSDAGLGVKRRRILFLNLFSVIGGLLCLILAFETWRDGAETFVYASNVAVGLIFLSMLGLVRLVKNTFIVSEFFLMVGLAGSAILLLFGGIEESGIYWLTPFPVVAFFLTGRRLGSFFSGLQILIVIAFLVLDYSELIASPYAFRDFKEIGLVLILLSIMSYITEYYRGFDEYNFNEQRKELTRINVQLGKEVKNRFEAEERLRKHAEQLEKLNRLMVGRELKMIDLKAEIQKLRDKLIS